MGITSAVFKIPFQRNPEMLQDLFRLFNPRFLQGLMRFIVAKDEIKRLKEELDTKSYKLAKGQKEEDKQIFIKVALVALSTGARLKEITETLELSSRKGVIYFINGDEEEEGIILGLDIKTVRAYLKDIRSHYGERIAKGTDISTGIRKAVKRLNIQDCGNTNNLNTLYKNCLTSSAQK